MNIYNSPELRREYQKKRYAVKKAERKKRIEDAEQKIINNILVNQECTLVKESIK